MIRIHVADYRALTALQRRLFDACGEKLRLGDPAYFNADGPVDSGAATHVAFDDHRLTAEHEATAEAIVENPARLPAEASPATLRVIYRTRIDEKLVEKRERVQADDLSIRQSIVIGGR